MSLLRSDAPETHKTIDVLSTRSFKGSGTVAFILPKISLRSSTKETTLKFAGNVAPANFLKTGEQPRGHEFDILCLQRIIRGTVLYIFN